MRTTFALTALALLASSASLANDSWAGWYIGVHAGTGGAESQADVSLGGRWSTESQELRDFVSSQWSTELDGSGSAFGIYGGYRHQLTDGLVLGVELEYSRLSIDDSRQTDNMSWLPGVSPLTYSFGNRIEANSMYAVRPMLGFAFDRQLVFLAAGWASVDVDASAEVLSNGGYSKYGDSSDSLTGMQWGVGYEFAFGNRWSVRAEYLMTDLDEVDYNTDYRPGSTFTNPVYSESVSQDLDLEIFRVGASFSF
ncbi:MAG: outer membrane protein [Pseudomonadota bacterium]